MYQFLNFLILAFVEIVYLKMARKYKLFDIPNERSSHEIITIKGGGVIVFVCVLNWYYFENSSSDYFLLGLFIISAISFLDDVFNLNQFYRLIFQFISILFILKELSLLSLPLIYLIICIVLLLGMINTFNFMDGINGMSILYCTVSLCTFYFMPALIGFKTLIEYLLIAAIIFGFLNVRKKPISFLGDVGSISLAYVLSFFMVLSILIDNKIEYLLFFTVFGTDSVMTIISRLIEKENIFYPHRNHLYQKLVNEKNISHLKISLAYAFLQGIINLILLFFIFPHENSFTISIILQIFICFFYLIINRNFLKN